MKRKELIISFIIAIVISACANTERQKISESGGTPDKPMNELTFFDSTVFDKELSKAMKAREGAIEVAPIVKFSPNEVPARMGKWFYTIDQHGGKLETEETSTKTRGLLGAGTGIDLIITAGKKIHDWIQYKPARDYNATLYYNADVGLVEKVVFTRKAGS
jgi:hypothetical protein